MADGLWLAGGRQGRAAGALDRDHEPLYDAGVLARLDLRTPRVAPVLEDRSSWSTGEGSCFKGLSRAGDRLLACHRAEVVAIAGGRVLERVSDPRYNDLHHAIEAGGQRLVASTGADAVVGPRRVWTLGGPLPAGDLRDRRLKPHAVHPNHLFEVDGRVFVTRGMRGDAVSLDGDVRWRLADVVVHDGVVRADGVWFTAVDGRLLRVDPTRGVVDREVRLAELDPREPPLGWCRGLAFVGAVAWVGFSRLRATRLRQNLAWLRGWVRGAQRATVHPTRVVAYDLEAGRLLAEVEVEGVGMHALFGVVPDLPDG